jgi:hypothetical protein
LFHLALLHNINICCRLLDRCAKANTNISIPHVNSAAGWLCRNQFPWVKWSTLLFLLLRWRWWLQLWWWLLQLWWWLQLLVLLVLWRTFPRCRWYIIARTNPRRLITRISTIRRLWMLSFGLDLVIER